MIGICKCHSDKLNFQVKMYSSLLEFTCLDCFGKKSFSCPPDYRTVMEFNPQFANLATPTYKGKLMGLFGIVHYLLLKERKCNAED